MLMFFLDYKGHRNEPYVQCTKEANVLIYLVTAEPLARADQSYHTYLPSKLNLASQHLQHHKNLIHLKGD